MKLFLLLFLLTIQILPQFTRKDISIIRGDYQLLYFEYSGDITEDSLTFVVKADTNISLPRLINKTTSQMQLVYNGRNTILAVILNQEDTQDLQRKQYWYDITADSQTIFQGKITLMYDVQTPFDGTDLPEDGSRFYVAGAFVDSTTADSSLFMWDEDSQSLIAIPYQQYAGLIIPDSLVYTSELPYINVKDYGAVGDGVTDDILAIQSAVDYTKSIKGTLVFPPGKYRITNTIFVGETGFCTMSIKGTQGFDEDNLNGSLIIADFGDRPAINIQGARAVTIEGINIQGRNEDKIQSVATTLPNDESAYIDTGLTYGRYNPYAGITIDGYSSPQPDSQYYTNHAYNGSTSYNVTIRNCTITGFVVGVGNTISAQHVSGAITTIEKCQMTNNTYSIVGGGTQNRGNAILNSSISGSYILFDNTGRFGVGDAPPFKIVGGDFGLCYKMFNYILGADVVNINGVYAESIKSIGVFGGSGAIDCSGIISGSHFSFTSSYGNLDVYPVLSAASLEFNGCTFSGGGIASGIFNSVGAKYNSCKFISTGGAGWDDIFYIGRTTYHGDETILENSSIRTDYLASNTFKPVNFYQRTLSLPKRIETSPASTFIQTADSLYFIYSGAPNSMESVSIDTSYWDNDTLYAITHTSGEILENDILYWQTTGSRICPMLKTVGAIGDSIIAIKLFDSTNYNYAYDPSSIFVAQREWATNETLTGDIASGRDTIFNVSDESVIKVGDFVKGTGLAENTRVTYVGGDTIIISKNATLTITGTTLYYGKVKNIRQSIGDLSEIENISDVLGNYIVTDSSGLVSNKLYVDLNTGDVKYTIPTELISNGDFTDWTGTGKGAYPDGWTVVETDSTIGNYFEQSPNGELHFVYSDSTGDYPSPPSISYRTSLTLGERYGYSFDVTQSTGIFTISIAGNRIGEYGVVHTAEHYSGQVISLHPWAVAIYPEIGGSYGDITLDNFKVWKINGEVSPPPYDIVTIVDSLGQRVLPDTTGITDGYVPKLVSGEVVWSPDISTSGSGLFNPDGVTIDTTAGGLARVLPAKVTKWDSVSVKQNKDADLDDLADGELSASKVAGVKDADYGDITVSSGVWAVEDDSHNHIISNVDGLQTALDAKQDAVSSFDTLTVTFGIMDTVTTGDYPGWKVPNNITITEVSAYTNTGTVTFNLEERGETTPNTAGTDVIGSDLVADTDQQETSTFSNSTLDRNDWLVMSVTSISGDPTIFGVTIRYVKTN